MLELSGVEVSYGPVQAVRGIDLHVGEREVVAVIGPNGAGKSSTLRAISGLAPFRGSIQFDGMDCRRLSVQGGARRGLIHVPEGRRVFTTLSVHENLLVGATARRGRTDGYGVDEVYDLFPALAPIRRRVGGALSGGEQQMVAIGRALVAGPRLLLLDEPSLGLAPLVVREIFRIVRTINQEQRVSVLLVEQNAAMALRLADRAYLMETGRVVMSGSAAELREHDTVRRAYLGY